jgi:hypothetical protein
MTRPQKITFGEMRSSGVRGLLIYCSDHHCSHSIAISADPWPDDVRLSDLEPRFVCQACGRRGADVRPDFHWDKPARRGDGLSLVPWSARFDHGPSACRMIGGRVALIAAGTEHLKPGSRNWGIPAGWDWISSPKRGLQIGEYEWPCS